MNCNLWQHLLGEGITLGDLNDITITSLTNNDILFVTDSTANSPFVNAQLEMNLILDATTQGQRSSLLFNWCW